MFLSLRHCLFPNLIALEGRRVAVNNFGHLATQTPERRNRREAVGDSNNTVGGAHGPQGVLCVILQLGVVRLRSVLVLFVPVRSLLRSYVC